MKKNNRKGRILDAVIGFILLIIILMTIINYLPSDKEKPKELSYKEFMQYAKEGMVESINIVLSDETFRFTLKDDKKEEKKKEEYLKAPNPKYEDFKKDMLELGIEVNESKSFANYSSYIFSIASLLIMCSFFFTIAKVQNGDKWGIKKEKKDSNQIKFEDIAGLDEVKSDLETIVDFLKNPGRYKEAGAKLPKGVLLYGPPGTGKTMLARAIAGEAGVEFLSAVGSEFDEKFVGVGAQRIRTLFSNARKKAPCIIFIDEIDALGLKRSSDKGSGNRQTINQLLSEMDGFTSDDNIIVIAATNKLEDLDFALTRPGRFDSQFAVPLPVNSSDRKKIIDIYVKNKKIGEDVDLNLLAKETLGCSPADIEGIINESAILATKENDGIITKAIIDDAFYKQVMKGHKKKDLERKEEEKKITAWHESAHAMVGILLGQEITKVTIIPSTSGAEGVTFFNNEKMGMYSKDELANQVMTLYAGRVAEEILAGDGGITTGASNDIAEATKIIKAMVESYGMSECGLLDYRNMEGNEVTAGVCLGIANTLYTETMDLVLKHKKTLEEVANKLMLMETMTGEEVKSIMDNKIA